MFITLTRGEMTAKDKQVANTTDIAFISVESLKFFETPKILNSNVLLERRNFKTVQSPFKGN